MTRRLAIALAAAALLLAACNQTASPPPTPAGAAAGVTPSAFALPSGSGCSGEITRYRAVLDNDLATGHVARTVHGRVSAEVDEAATACAAGRDAEAVRKVAATKVRYGYR